MPTVELIVRLGAGVLLILANAFFVVTEFALTRLPHLEEGPDEGAGLRRARSMTERLEIYLTGCQLGISATSILLGIVAEPAVTSLLRPLFELVGLEGAGAETTSIVVGVVLINLIHKIWGEQAPTYLGVERPLQVSRWAAPVHYWWTKITYPFIYLGDGLAKKTLRLIGVEITRSWTEAEVEAEEEEGEGLERIRGRTELKQAMGRMLSRTDLPRERRREVMNTLTIGEQPVREIMVPREEVVALSTARSIDENRRLLVEHPHSRYPLVGGSLDDPIGIVYLHALFRDFEQFVSGEVTLEDVAAPAPTLPAETSVSDFIDRLQEEEQELAFIEDEERVVGIATATDAFEAIAGELHDPLDAEG